MTGRLADISERIVGVGQLGAVVGAMRGIAAARAQQARNQLAAVDGYTAIIAAAIGRTLALVPTSFETTQSEGPPVMVLFCAEQGFAGAFSERVLAVIPPGHQCFLIGTRGIAVAAERGITPAWAHAMPSHSPGIPRLADTIMAALTSHIAARGIGTLEVVFTDWQPSSGTTVQRHRPLPFDPTTFARVGGRTVPLLNLSPAALLAGLTAEYLHAQLCNAALHAFAAENEARMERMAAATGQIERQLAGLEATRRTVRQEEITAEIIELAAGETAAR